MTRLPSATGDPTDEVRGSPRRPAVASSDAGGGGSARASAPPAPAKAGDGSTHEWTPGQHRDLIVTLDAAASEHYPMFFVEEEATASSFRAMAEVIEARVRAPRCPDGRMAVFHGPSRLADYEADGSWVGEPHRAGDDRREPCGPEDCDSASLRSSTSLEHPSHEHDYVRNSDEWSFSTRLSRKIGNDGQSQGPCPGFHHPEIAGRASSAMRKYDAGRHDGIGGAWTPGGNFSRGVRTLPVRRLLPDRGRVHGWRIPAVP